MIDVLYIFHYSSDKIEKAKKRLECSKESLKGQDCNIIVADYTGKYNGLFNKSLLINHAVKNYIKNDWFILSDIDLIYQSDYIERMKPYITDRVIPYNYNIYQECYSSNFSELMKLTHSPGGFAHGNGEIYKPHFMDIRGYNECFVGYGPEDDCFNKRIQKAGSKLVYDSDIITCHLWHEPLNRIQHDKNMQMYWKILQDIEAPNANLKLNGEKWGEI